MAGTEIALNVYNLVLKDRNDLLGAPGFGIYHSGLEIGGWYRWEWSFGGCSNRPDVDPSTTGVFFVLPKSALPKETFAEQHVIGVTHKSQQGIHKIIDGIRKD